MIPADATLHSRRWSAHPGRPDSTVRLIRAAGGGTSTSTTWHSSANSSRARLGGRADTGLQSGLARTPPPVVTPHREIHLGIWGLTMIDGVPYGIAPPWIDPRRRPPA